MNAVFSPLKAWIGLGLAVLVGAAAVWNFFFPRTPAAEGAPLPPSYVPVVAATALDGWQGFPEDAHGASPSIPCADLPRKWIILCWDGADWGVMLPMIEKGEMPNVTELMKSGAYGNLHTIAPSLSPVVWTSIATGTTPDRHGILGFIHEDDAKNRKLYSNVNRKAKAIWNLLSDFEKSILIVGYHNTYPAEPVNGILVSNYLFHRRMAELNDFSDELSDFERGLCHPLKIFDIVKSFERHQDSVTPKKLRSFANMDNNVQNNILNKVFEHEIEKTRWDFLQRAYLYDEIYFAMWKRFQKQSLFDVSIVHFQSLDLISHFYLVFHEPPRVMEEKWPLETRNELKVQRKIYQDTVKSFYQRIDRWLGAVLESKDDETAVMVLSDHGFSRKPRPDKNTGGYAHHDDAPAGVLFMAGPGIKVGYQIEDANVYDILPTLMACLRLPVAQDLDGKILHEVFCEGALDGEIQYVPTYGAFTHGAKTAELPETMNQEIQEQLKSLGYIN